jgi:hypothetical protein
VLFEVTSAAPALDGASPLMLASNRHPDIAQLLMVAVAK